MDLNKKSMKKIRELIVFTAILVVALVLVCAGIYIVNHKKIRNY